MSRGRSGAPSSFAQVRAIVRRDIKVQLTYPFQLVLQFEGAAFAVCVALFMSRIVPASRLLPYESGYFAFALVGLIATLLASVGVTSVTASFGNAQREGTLEILLLGPVRLQTILVGTLVVPLSLATVEIAGCLAVGIAFGSRFEWAGFVIAIPIIGLLVASFAAIGIMSAATVLLTKRGEPLAIVLAQATALLGGALFPVEVLPGWLRLLSHVLPPYYGLNALRAVLLPGGEWADVVPNVVGLAAITAALLPFSLWCLARSLRVARVSGTLGTY